MKMLGIVIVKQKRGSDKVYVMTNLPVALPVFGEHTLTIEFTATKGTAERYCADHFPDVPIERVFEAGDK